jgi:hypothetical protein
MMSALFWLGVAAFVMLAVCLAVYWGCAAYEAVMMSGDDDSYTHFRRERALERDGEQKGA